MVEPILPSRDERRGLQQSNSADKRTCRCMIDYINIRKIVKNDMVGLILNFILKDDL